MDATELDGLEMDVCALITKLEQLRSTNAVLRSKLADAVLERENLKISNTKISLRIKQIIQQLKGDENA
jgi:uncharacterized protein (TIGR02449 family)